MQLKQITENPPKREGILPSVKFNPKSYGIEYVGFYLLQKGDKFHFFFEHKPQNQVYEIIETDPHGRYIKLLVGDGNTHCPFIGTELEAAPTIRSVWSTHGPFIKGFVSNSSADVIRIKKPK